MRARRWVSEEVYAASDAVMPPGTQAPPGVAAAWTRAGPAASREVQLRWTCADTISTVSLDILS